MGGAKSSKHHGIGEREIDVFIADSNCQRPSLNTILSGILSFNFPQQ